ncbi:type II toxin-antitoxin system RelE/ParE family toxin, partial [Candidatus Kaiserbacteria bacterium]|nr:type II toxin-antitoxin system RelE/ParE family toxin [Candidatus Kaiserbacteria bacterium]
MPDHKFTVIWSPEADFDLLEIWRWGAKHFSSEIADAHAQDILRLTANLQDAPLLGRSRDDLLGGIRSVVVYPTLYFIVLPRMRSRSFVSWMVEKISRRFSHVRIVMGNNVPPLSRGRARRHLYNH